MTVEDLKRYQYGAIAADAKEIGTQLGALEKQLVSMGGVNDDIHEGFIQSLLKNDQARTDTANVYAKKYQRAFKDSTLGELVEYYQNANGFGLGNYFNENELNLLRLKVSPYGNRKIKDLRDGLKEANKLLKRAADGERIPERDIQEATSNKSMYSEVLKTVNTFDLMRRNSLESQATMVGNESINKLQKKGLMEYIYGSDEERGE